MSLEPIRHASPSEPLLLLSAGDATLSCNARELIFADALGVQRLALHEIRKVTHVEGYLVVTSSTNSIRGVLNVSSSDLKAFFADVQTLRKQRDAALVQPLESRFKPAPLEKLGIAPLEKPNSSSLERPIPAPAQIPGFSMGISAAHAEMISPRVAPAAVPATRVQPIPAESSPVPTAAPVEDLLQYQPRPAKPNPRANLRSEREELPPPKPNPRAVVIQTPAPTVSSAPAPIVPPAEISQALVNDLRREPRAAAFETPPQTARAVPLDTPRVAPPSGAGSARLEKKGAGPLEKTGSSPLEKPRVAATSQPRAAVLTQPRRIAPTLPSVKLELPKVDASAVWQRLRGHLARQTPDLRFHLRRAAASAIDAALSLALMWGATRIIGGRELETLLRLPSDTRADLSMLEPLKDLLPLYIAGALSGVLIALAAGLLYAVISELSPLRGTPGRHFMGLHLRLLSGARVSPAVVAARYLVKAMLLLVPSVLGLLPTLIALNGPAIALRSSLQLFGYTDLAGLIVLLIGQLPIYGPQRAQTLADYLTDCIVRDAPKAAPLET